MEIFIKILLNRFLISLYENSIIFQGHAYTDGISIKTERSLTKFVTKHNHFFSFAYILLVLL